MDDKFSITMHALERLEERLIPMIRGPHKKFLTDSNNIEKSIYSLLNVNRESLTLVEGKAPERGGSFYDMKFRSYDGVIPLRGVIRDNVLVTIWPLGGWRKVTSQS